MIDMIQPITVQQAYKWITHSQRWASWTWWWRKVDDKWRHRIPPSGAPNGFQISPPNEEHEAVAPYRKTQWILLSDFFLPREHWSWSWGWWRSKGATRTEGAPPTLWPGCGPPSVDSFASIFYLFQNWSSWIFRSFRELIFLHKSNTMAIMLKTTSVWVSSYSNHAS